MLIQRNVIYLRLWIMNNITLEEEESAPIMSRSCRNSHNHRPWPGRCRLRHENKERRLFWQVPIAVSRRRRRRRRSSSLAMMIILLSHYFGMTTYAFIRHSCTTRDPCTSACARGTAKSSVPCTRSKSTARRQQKGDATDDNDDDGDADGAKASLVAKPFGRQEYWESFYDEKDADFSWYSTWEEMEPFVVEWQPPPSSSSSSKEDDNCTAKTVLVPGIGSDTSLLQSMYKSGYTRLAAFDYAPSAVAHCQAQLAAAAAAAAATDSYDDDDSETTNKMVLQTIDLQVADATQSLPYPGDSMCLIIDKGTLDAISIVGQSGGDKRRNRVRQAVQQLQRVLTPGGIFWSLSGICTDILRSDELECWQGWELLADSTQELVITSDGYTSNNLDGNLLVWRKPSSGDCTKSKEK